MLKILLISAAWFAQIALFRQAANCSARVRAPRERYLKPSLTTEACWLLNGSLRKKLPLVTAESGVNKSPFSTSEVGKEQARAVAAVQGNEGRDAEIAGGFGGDAASPRRWKVGAEEGSPLPAEIIKLGIFRGRAGAFYGC